MSIIDLAPLSERHALKIRNRREWLLVIGGSFGFVLFAVLCGIINVI